MPFPLSHNKSSFKFAVTTNACLIFLSCQQTLAQEAAPPSQGSPNAAISMYNLGLKAYKEGTPESAIIFFNRACTINPDLADAQYNLAVLYQTQKRFREAIPRYQEVLRVKPQDPDAHYQLALCYIDMGQYPEARQHLQTIAPNNPHFADAQKRLSLLESQNPQSAAIPSTPSITMPQPSATPPADPTYQAPPQSYNPPTTSPSTAAVSSYSSTPQMGGTPTVAYTPPVTVQTIQTSQPATAPLVVAPQTSMPPSATPTHQAGGPVAVLANANVRIIATGFNAPAGLAFDKQGNLYVANFKSNTVDRINVDGSRNQFSSGANLKGPIGLAIDATNNVYVANYYSGTIARISPSGVSTIIATGFKMPYYLTLDKDGSLFVSQQEDNSVVRITVPRSGSRPM